MPSVQNTPSKCSDKTYFEKNLKPAMYAVLEVFLIDIFNIQKLLFNIHCSSRFKTKKFARQLIICRSGCENNCDYDTVSNKENN